MSKRCKHPNKWLTDLHVRVYCGICGEFVSLGPSNDRIPPAELHLAELLAEIPQLWEPGASRDEAIEVAVDDCAEWCA